MKYVTLPDGTVIPVNDDGTPVNGSIPIIILPPNTPPGPPPPASGPPAGSTPGGGVGGIGGGGRPVPPPIPKPIAGFSYTVYASGIVGFFNASLGNVSAYLWNFGDGNFLNTKNALHQYSANGTYSVTLEVANSSGVSSKTLTVVVSGISSPETVDFSFAFSGLGVQFTDSSTKSGDRLWDFGDGKLSSEVNPYHLYASNGAYTVTLSIGEMKKSRQVAIDRGVFLTWQDNSSDETGFKIERSPDGVTGWTQIATTGANVNSLLVTFNLHGIDPTAINYFRVRAQNGGGDSGYTNVVETQCL